MVKRWAIKYPSGAYDVMSNLVPKRLCSVIVSFRKKKYPFIFASSAFEPGLKITNGAGATRSGL